MAKNKFQCWLCDGSGDIYFTQDVLGSSNADEKKGWSIVDSNVGSGFSSVSAGYSGMVCAIKNESLYLRTHLTSKKPSGSSWEDCHCNAIKVLVGTRCIVRQITLGSWFYTSGLLDWKAVGLETDETFGEKEDYDDKPSLSNYVIDSRDKLYAFTETNQVAFCDLAKSELQWTIVIESFTSALSKSSKILKWVTNKLLWGEDSTSFAAADGDRSIWCHAANSSEIWQLVTSQVGTSVKYDWIKFAIPCKKTDEKIVLVEACKVTVGKLYFVLTHGDKHKIAVLCLDGGENKLVNVAYPGVWPCRSLATSYLPCIEEERECCGDGSCGSCESLKRPRVKDKESGPQGNCRKSSELHTPKAKRRKVVSHSSLLNGVTVRNTFLSRMDKFQFSYDISGVDTKIDFNKYVYDFSLENQVLRFE